jgi:hypothetical protein
MFTVYMHITPSNKRYIGITSKDLSERFGSNGCLYRNQIFGRAIKKYGWDNIEHIIVAQNLTKERAKKLEIELIAKYDTTNPKYGYNRSIGGDIPVILGQHHSEETKKKISDSNKGKEISLSTRKQISDSVKSLWQTNEYREKQNNRAVSDISKKRMSEAHKGKILSEKHKEKIRLGNLGKHQSDKTKQMLSEIVKRQHQREKELGIKRNYSNDGTKTGGTKWYNNGVKNIRSKNGCPEGYVTGRLHYEYPKNRKSRKVPSTDDAEPRERTERKVREVKRQFKNDKEDVF